MTIKTMKLGEIATFINGYPFKPSEWSTEGLEIIRIQNLTKSNSSESNYYQGTLPEKYKVKYGDILISWSATLDVFEWAGEDAWLNQHIFKVKFDKLDIDKVFFKYAIVNLIDSLRRQVHGATMQHITKGKFDSTEVLVPEKPNQKRIAEILDKADALRKKDKQLLQYYDNLAQSLFIDMFGDPVRNEKGWEMTTIGKVCFYVKDGPHVSPKYSTTGVPFISVNNIIRGFIDLSNAKYITHEDYIIYSKKGKPEKGDILYTKGGTTGFAKRVDMDFEFMNWVHIAILKFDKNIINEVFFESMLNTSFCYAQSQRLTKGIANRDLVLGEMKKIKILLPPLSLQSEFAAQIQNIEQQKEKLKAQLQESENLFQALLQKAFNGGLN